MITGEVFCGGGRKSWFNIARVAAKAKMTCIAPAMRPLLRKTCFNLCEQQLRAASRASSLRDGGDLAGSFDQLYAKATPKNYRLIVGI